MGLLETLTAALAAALVLGLLTHRLGLSPILGYLVAGALLGPHTPGPRADPRIAAQLSEVGVVLLMFGVGLGLHLRDLLAVRWTALPGALVTSLVSAGLGAALARAFGWTAGPALLLGLGLCVASTVVLMRSLMDSDRLDSPEGHVAIGWLVVEDGFTVLVLLLLPALARAFGGGGGGGETPGVGGALLLALLRVAGLGALMLLVVARLVPRLLTFSARTRSRELFTLTVLALALALATLSSHLFGVSMALGAFLAGLVVAQSRTSHQAASDALPMRDAFAVLFFVSVGMLFDPALLAARPGLVLGMLCIVLAVKPAVAFCLLILLRSSPRVALTVAVGLAQIGEFSFILAELARSLGLLPAEGQSLLVACALISISLNPLLFRALAPIERFLRRRPRLWQLLSLRAERRTEAAAEITAVRLAREVGRPRAVVVGYGPVGRTVTRILRDFGLEPVVVDLNVDTVNRLAAEGRPAIYGDAGRPDVLRAAGIQDARFLVVTLPDLPSRIPIIIAARDLNPDLRILVRARYLREREMLEDVGASAACYEEAEAAVALAGVLLREIGAPRRRIEDESQTIRVELAVQRPETTALEAAPGPPAPGGSP